MKRLARGIAGLLAAAGLCLLAAGGILGGLGARMADRPPEERMRNVRLLPRPAAERQRVKAPVQSAAVAPPLLPVLETEAPRPSPEGRESVRETTIEGGLRIKNETGYWVDAAEILAEGPGLTLPPDEAQILIIHTHASEAYTQAGLDRYAASDTNRTEDTQFNIVRIGDELTELLTEYGLNVIHDRGIYDYPSYTGSYTRAGEAIEQYLQNCPGIRIVFDIHRDALGANGVVYKTMAEEEGTVASQIMLLVGTDESGLEHPYWRSNLALALYLQNAVNSAFPTLMRPVALVPQRYNQQLTQGSLILEVGSSGNTLREAIAAIRLFARAAGPALAELVAAE
ncbi:MAG: stage II sporulation protein P [Oscillospiraceae bacterium]|nr:stage II sporulation protein P [Oscillospiraceae bacterium]